MPLNIASLITRQDCRLSWKLAGSRDIELVLSSTCGYEYHESYYEVLQYYIMNHYDVSCRRAAVPLKVSLENTSALHFFKANMNHFVCISNSQSELEGNRANPANLGLGRLRQSVRL